MDSVSVRKMVAKDINEVLMIERSSFSIPWTKGAFQKELKQNLLARYFVVELNNNIVGYGGMWLILDEAHITNIAIDPEFRGMKLGKKLVEAMVDEAKSLSIAKMTLEVRRSNHVAQNLYKGFGFLSCGVRPGYYSDNGEDALIMWKEIE